MSVIVFNGDFIVRQMIMMCGLPGVGKTTWATNYARDHPEKRYNIIGTDSLIDKMKVMGLPRKRNFGGRWDVLISKSSACLNKLFEIGKYYVQQPTNFGVILLSFLCVNCVRGCDRGHLALSLCQQFH